MRCVVGKRQLGSGAFSKVFEGTYRGQPAAVKFFLRLNEVTPETIALYAKETAIMAAVSHPNIVLFHGSASFLLIVVHACVVFDGVCSMCVRPPAICLVMELCSRGSLYRVLAKACVCSFVCYLTCD